MSNYLFVAGKKQQVDKIKSCFQEIYGAMQTELSLHEVSDETAVLVVERRNSENESSISLHDSGHGLFFRGQALDHETKSMILGAKGFFDFQNKFPDYLNPSQVADFEGSFVLARWDESNFRRSSEKNTTSSALRR